MLFVKISQYSQEDTYVEVAFTALRPATLLKRDSNTVFSSEYWEISKNTYFEEHPRTTASEVTLGSDCLGLSFWRVAFKTIQT